MSPLFGLGAEADRRPTEQFFAVLFPTFTFAVFFLVVYGAHVLLRARPTAWKYTMLLASAVFYAWWDERFLTLIAGSILFNWWAANNVSRATGRKRKRTVRFAVATNLGLLGFFKYYGFFVESLTEGFGAGQPLPFIEVILPVGISFYTFQAISYVVDVSRRDVRTVPLIDVAVFLSFFPQLVAGPIVRAKEFLPQLRRHRLDDAVDSFDAAWMIGRGLFKKVVIATYLGETVVDPVFAAPTEATKIELLTAMYGYAIQIYADFSGYTDIAIGIALLLGFRFPVNFDNPYRSLSVQDFWRRWHITLSNWLRDYLYIAMGGNRLGSFRTYRNLMVTMVLGGLWHGAAWTFVAWGAIHGLALVIERLLGRGSPHTDRPIASIARWAITFHVVCVAWVLFRAETFGLAADFLAGIISAPLGTGVEWWALAVIAGSLAMQFLPTDVMAAMRQRGADTDPLLQGALLGIWIALVVALGPDGVAPFIYFQF